MAEYTITEINSGIAKVTFSDNSWAEIVLNDKMTEEELDSTVMAFAPKSGSVPSFVNVGDKRTAKIGEEDVTGTTLSDSDLKELTQDDKATMARNRRDMFLDRTDKVIIECVEKGQAVPDDWKTYRQALRDLPTQGSSVWAPDAEINEDKNGYNVKGVTYPTLPTNLPDGKTKSSAVFPNFT